MEKTGIEPIHTKHLVLREWEPRDIAPFAAINKDPKVMEYFYKPLTEEETLAMVERFQEHFKKHGFGIYACELKETSGCIGFVGLNIPDFEAPFTPCVEIGWRLSSSVWGKGYAPEAARAVLKAAFTRFGLEEVVAFTVPMNSRSLRVMEKLGMKKDPKGDFDHPRVPEGHSLRRHVLYRITRSQYEHQ